MSRILYHGIPTSDSIRIGRNVKVRLLGNGRPIGDAVSDGRGRISIPTEAYCLTITAIDDTNETL